MQVYLLYALPDGEAWGSYLADAARAAASAPGASAAGEVASAAWASAVSFGRAAAAAAALSPLAALARPFLDLAAAADVAGAVFSAAAALWAGAPSAAEAAAPPAFFAAARISSLLPASRVQAAVFQAGFRGLMMPLDALFALEASAVALLHGLPARWWTAALRAAGLWALRVASSALMRRALWAVLVLRSYFVLARIGTALFPDLSPLWLYALPFRALAELARGAAALARRLAGHNDAALARATRLCKRGGLMGDLALVPLALCWMGWPLALPHALGSRVAWVCAASATAALAFRSVGIISRAWGVRDAAPLSRAR